MSYQSQPPPPPLLFTKRLTLFLQQSLRPPLHTTLLTSSTGKLLAHASHSAVSVLRTQCTVASSLWTLHTSSGAAIPDALPSSSPSTPSTASPPRPSSITVQLSGGIVVVRKLRCGLLLVCIGHPPDAEEGQPPPQPRGREGSVAAAATPTPVPLGGTGSPPLPPGSPSEADSVLSVGAVTTASYASVGSVGAAAVGAMRRQSEDLGRWLDDKLGSLRVPDEGVGVD